MPLREKPCASWRLLLVDSDPVFRDGIRQWVGQFLGIENCTECDSGPEALEAMHRWQPDLAIMELLPAADDGIEWIRQMLAEQPALIVLVLSALEETEYALPALRVGAKGYLMKQAPPETVTEALLKLMEGGMYVSPLLKKRLVFQVIVGGKCDFGPPLDQLTDREFEVLQLFALAKRSREVSERVGLSTKTVETYRQRAIFKLRNVS